MPVLCYKSFIRLYVIKWFDYYERSELLMDGDGKNSTQKNVRHAAAQLLANQFLEDSSF